MRDYADSGLTIQDATLDLARRFPDRKQRPDYLLWGGRRVKTGDRLSVPARGVIRGEFLSSKGDVEQGFDLEVDGWLRLKEGERVASLRTWQDPRYDPVVEYPFQTKSGQLWVWNVYKVRYPGDQVVEEKWTGNAGMWIEEPSPTERIYHCSPGVALRPDFESLVFRISIHSS